MRHSFSQIDVTRAIKGAKAGGMEVNTVEVGPDGSIRISNQKPANISNPYDDWKAHRENGS